MLNKINIPVDRVSGKPKGFAFVEFKSKNSALKAVSTLNETVFKGRTISVALSVDKRRYEVNPEEKTETKEEPLKVKEDEAEPTENDKEEVEEVEEPAEKQETIKSSNKGTIFIRNVDFDIDDDQLYKHFKTLSHVVWAKTCRNEEDPSKHKGSAFVKFKNPAVAKKLIKMSSEINEKPEDKVLIDPKNILELNNRQLMVLSTLSREEVGQKVLERKPVKISAKKKKKLGLDDLIQLDRKNRRNFNLAVEGLAITDDNVTANNDVETQKRSRHLVS